MKLLQIILAFLTLAACHHVNPASHPAPQTEEKLDKPATKKPLRKAKSDGLTAQEREFLATSGKVDDEVRPLMLGETLCAGFCSGFSPAPQPQVSCVVAVVPGAAVAGCVSQ